MKRTIALVALTLLALTGTTAATAGDSKDACKNGGHSQYVDPATGQPFTNQGQCVSFVNSGGTLVPVEGTPPSGGAGGTADIEFSNPRNAGPSGWVWDLKVSGLPADTVVELSWTQLTRGALPEPPPSPLPSRQEEKWTGPLVMTQPDGTLSMGQADRYAFGRRDWSYGQCGDPVTKDVTVRGPGFKVTEPVPVPPACTP